MSQAANPILKASQVRRAEPVTIGPSARGGPAAASAPAARARIVEQEADHTVIEVVCVCGAAMQLVCTFDAAAAGEAAGADPDNHVAEGDVPCDSV